MRTNAKSSSPVVPTKTQPEKAIVSLFEQGSKAWQRKQRAKHAKRWKFRPYRSESIAASNQPSVSTQHVEPRQCFLFCQTSGEMLRLALADIEPMNSLCALASLVEADSAVPVKKLDIVDADVVAE
jgi:hypothetical protein